MGCERLPEKFHGKEGVDGSSPSEGLKYLQIGTLCCLFRRATSGGNGRGRDVVDLQVFFPFKACFRRVEGEPEGTRAFLRAGS